MNCQRDIRLGASSWATLGLRACWVGALAIARIGLHSPLWKQTLWDWETGSSDEGRFNGSREQRVGLAAGGVGGVDGGGRWEVVAA